MAGLGVHKVQIKYLFPFLQFLFGSVPAFPPFILWSSVDLNLLFVLLKKKKSSVHFSQQDSSETESHVTRSRKDIS